MPQGASKHQVQAEFSSVEVAGASAPVSDTDAQERVAWQPSRIVRRMVWAALAAGVALRLWQYLLNRSLWLDEAYLALNLTHRSFAGLLKPLDFDQGAPLAFLWMEKALLRVFGNGEYALRLLPLVAGLVSLLLFYKLAKDVLSPAAAAFAISLFAVSPSLIYYSSEAKQYSLDVVITILIYCLAIPGSRAHWSAARIALFGVFGAIAIWCSHPATFVLAAVAAVFTVSLARHKQWYRLARLMPAFLMWGASLAICYFLSLRALSQNHQLLAYWQMEFMPLPPRSVSDVKWFLDSFFDFFVEAIGLQFTALAGFVFLVGGARLLRERGERLALLLAPAALTLLASGLHKYPFGGRLALFLVPAAVLLIAQGIEEVRLAAWAFSPLIPCVLIAILFVDPAVFLTRHFAEPRTEVDHPGFMVPEEIKPVMAYVRNHQQAGDFVYVFYASQPAFQYYSELYRQPQPNVILGTAAGDDPRAYAADLDRLRGRRVWVVLSHTHGIGKQESAYIRFYLDALGPRVTSFQSPGAATYLYDLTKAPTVAIGLPPGTTATAAK